MKKGQNTAEFIMVILFFIIITVILLVSYLNLFPSEAAKAKEQIACSNAELLSIQLLELPGNDSNWASSNDLNELGFSTENNFEINYSKIMYAKNLGYYNISTDSNLSVPFKLEYNAYAFNFTEEAIPANLPNEYSPRVFIIRNESNLIIYSGSNSTEVTFSMTLFFPFTTVTSTLCDSGNLENEDTNSTQYKRNGAEIKLNWLTETNDLDCINLSLSEIPDLIFIKNMKLQNTTMGSTYPIYLSNEIILNQIFGSTGNIDKDKHYCEISRIGSINYETEIIPTKFKIMSWR